MRLLATILFSCSLLLAQEQPIKTPDQIERELQEAEAQFKRAQEMFNPWYTGPLLTPGATMMPVGYGNTQPYLYITNNYAQFDEDRNSHSLKHALISVNVAGGPLIQFGMTPSTDIGIGANGLMQWRDGSNGGGFGDLGVTVGFLVWKQSLYVPAIKFSVKETFPTGNYQDLSENGLNLSATGGGSFQTQFGLGLSKVVFWSYRHPMNLRAFFSYNVPTPVHVREFNAYGGGFETRAKVHPGNTFSTDVGIEYSFTQRWVAALDLAYTATNSTSFSGNPGKNRDGTPASLGGGYSDNLSLAPAIEYNWSPNGGCLGGLWFSVYGRNSFNFVSGILSVTYTFKV